MSKHFLEKTSFKNLVRDLPDEFLEKTQWFKIGEQGTPIMNFLGQKLTEFESDVERAKKGIDPDNELRPEIKRQKQTEQLKKAELNVLKGLNQGLIRPFQIMKRISHGQRWSGNALRLRVKKPRLAS